MNKLVLIKIENYNNVYALLLQMLNKLYSLIYIS